jgi:hypothetical protein
LENTATTTTATIDTTSAAATARVMLFGPGARPDVTNIFAALDKAGIEARLLAGDDGAPRVPSRSERRTG